MRMFWEWVRKIGYTEAEIKKLPKYHIEILMEEFSMLLKEMGGNQKWITQN